MFPYPAKGGYSSLFVLTGISHGFVSVALKGSTFLRLTALAKQPMVPLLPVHGTNEK